MVTITAEQEIVRLVVTYNMETSVSQNNLIGVLIEKPLNIVIVADFFAK